MTAATDCSLFLATKWGDAWSKSKTIREFHLAFPFKMEKFLFGKIKNWQQTSKKIAAFFFVCGQKKYNFDFRFFVEKCQNKFAS